MKSVNPPSQIRRLCLVLGDQLNLDSTVFDEFDPAQDAVWMAELPQEQTHVKSHQQRMVLFLSAMRHFAQTLNHQAWSLHYLKLGEHAFDSFEQALAAFLAHHSVKQVAVVLPG
ncbi:MAG: cryptochrome/photolyase family protein, partial [Hydrogenovibrio sp.]